MFERFERNVIPEPMSGCWLWLGTINTGGYGTIRQHGKKHLAHRLSFAAHKGEIPSGLNVLHRCDTPLCVNPDHLFLGTQADNVADRDRKGRGKFGGFAGWPRRITHCPKGHPYDEANTYRHKGYRQCRTCNRERQRR